METMDATRPSRPSSTERVETWATPDEKPWTPTPQEILGAFRVAITAQRVVEKIVTNGRPDANDFISLCHALEELRRNIVGVGEDHIPGAEFSLRFDDLDDGIRNGFRT